MNPVLRILSALVCGLTLFGAWDVGLAAVGISEFRVEPKRIQPGDLVKAVYQNHDLRNKPVYIHFGANGWNLPIPGASSEIDQGNLNYYVRARMVEVNGTGQFEYEFRVPTNARALHFAFCWDDCSNGDWDNNSGQDFAWQITFPYIGPVLTWNESTNPESGVVITFENAWRAGAWIEYGESETRTARLRSSPGLQHRFVLAGLKGGKTYRYRVGTDDGFTSQYFQFRTIPARTNNVTFLVFGDAQDNGENGQFANVAQVMASQRRDAQFVISTGDLPWNDKPGDWWSFFDKGRDLFANLVVMPAVGNHDTPTVGSSPDHRTFLHYFSLPGTNPNKAHYEFNVGPARFLALNSERPEEFSPGGAQYRWLEEKLAPNGLQSQSAASAWTFAFWHIPPFNAGSRHFGQQFDKRQLAGLFDEKVDWVFGGHEHMYQRMLPLRGAAANPQTVAMYGTGSGDGVGYLIVPSAGVSSATELVPIQAHPELRSLLAFPEVPPEVTRVDPSVGFARVEVTDNSILFTVLSVGEGSMMSPRQLDSVSYTK
jgi:hypothetical protein